MSIEIYQNLRTESQHLETIISTKPKDYELIDDFKEWLLSVEDYLRRNEIDDFRRIAEIRGRLIAAQVAFDRRVPKLKRQLKATTELIEISKNTMDTIMQPLEIRYSEPRKAISKMLRLAEHQGLIQWNNGLRYKDFVYALWRILKRESLYAKYRKQLKDRISDEEAIVLLSEELKPYLS